jgi:cardiolipin synthase
VLKQTILDRQMGRFADRRLPRHGMTFGNKVQLLANGAQAYPAMLETIRAAHHRIDMCMYIFRDDHIGMQFAQALASQAKLGRPVRVAYDAIGCSDINPRHFDMMRRCGVEVYQINPFLPKPITNFWHAIARDHRKILTVDDETAFIGGMNIGDEYDGHGTDENHWRDFAMKTTGPAAHYLRRLIDKTYQNSWGLVHRLHTHPHNNNHSLVWFQSPAPLDPRRIIVNTYNALIRNSRQYVYLATAYFLPNYRIVNQLIKAVRRGVDVRLILPQKGDVPIVHIASQLWYHHLLRHGVRIFERRSAILHAKAAVADDLAAVIGSANLDARAFYLNREVLATVFDETFACHLRRELESDFANSNEIQLQDVQKVRWPQRLKQRLAFAISPLL